MRLDPERSAIAARIHLFRYLDDANRLSRNPLVSHIFDAALARAPRQPLHARRVALKHIRDLVLDAFQECRAAEPSADAPYARQYEVFERGVLRKESARSIAQDLNISERQFRRDREAIINRTFAYLRHSLGVDRRITVETQGALHYLAEARLLQNIGAFDAALCRVEDVARCAPAISERVEALALQAILLLDQGRFDQSLRTLQLAERLYAASNSQPPCDELVLSGLRLELTRVRRSLSFGVSASLPALAQMRGKLLEQTQTRERTQLALEVFLAEVDACGYFGLFENARHLLQQAEPLVKACGQTMPTERMLFVASKATVAGATGDAAATVLELDDAIRYASELGLRRSLIELLCSRSQSRFLSRDGTAAAADIRRYLELARSYASPLVFADVARPAHLILSIHGNNTEPLQLIEEIEAARIPGPHVNAFLEASWAVFYSGRENWAKAHERATRALDLSTHSNNKRDEGTALRLLAVVLFAQNKKKPAMEAIVAAIDLTKRYGSQNAVRVCQRLYSRFSGRESVDVSVPMR